MNENNDANNLNEHNTDTNVLSNQCADSLWVNLIDSLINTDIDIMFKDWNENGYENVLFVYALKSNNLKFYKVLAISLKSKSILYSHYPTCVLSVDNVKVVLSITGEPTVDEFSFDDINLPEELTRLDRGYERKFVIPVPANADL
jgi:hypothetical protein